MSPHTNRIGSVATLIVALLSASPVSTLMSQVGVDSSRSKSLGDSLSIPREGGRVSIHSNPQGAEVYEGSRLVGMTPIERLPVTGGTHIFTLFYPSPHSWDAVWKSDTLVVARDQETRSIVDLAVSPKSIMVPERIPARISDQGLFLADSKNENGNRWLKYAAGATMIISGVASAYFKDRSNKDFDSYVATGDPSLLSSTHRFDRLAGATLAISQLSFGLLAYLLLSE
jgi:hypothetical protein